MPIQFFKRKQSEETSMAIQHSLLKTDVKRTPKNTHMYKGKGHREKITVWWFWPKENGRESHSPE